VTEHEYFLWFGPHSKYIPEVLDLQALFYYLFNSTLFLIKNASNINSFDLINIMEIILALILILPFCGTKNI